MPEHAGAAQIVVVEAYAAGEQSLAESRADPVALAGSCLLPPRLATTD
jgi:hypothetical protein